MASARASSARPASARDFTTSAVLHGMRDKHPVEVGDWVTVTQPMVRGSAVPLNGEVVTISLKSDGTSVGQMVMKVRCSVADVQNARRALRG